MSDDFQRRTVYDGFNHWQARVVEQYTWRGPRWQAVLDRHFGNSARGWWLHSEISYRLARPRKTRDEAVADANRMLDAMEPKRAEGEYV